MSLMSFTGKQRNLLDETPEHCRQLKLPHPILTNEDMERLRTAGRDDFKVVTLPALFRRPTRPTRPGLEPGAGRAGRRGRARRSRDGASLLILSDRDVSPKRAPIPSLLATAALHHGLLGRRLRSEAGIVVESGEPREVMHFCLLCGYGANAINPYLAFEAIHKLHADGDLPQDVGHRPVDRPVHHGRQEGHPQDDLQDGHLDAAQLPRGPAVRGRRAEPRGDRPVFHRHAVADRAACGLDVIAREALARHRAGFEPPRARRAGTGLRRRVPLPPRRREAPLEPRRRSSSCSTRCCKTTRRSTPSTPRRSTTRAASCARSAGCSSSCPASRCRWTRSSRPAQIVKRFYTGAMSHGSISKEAHETLAIAMNRLGGHVEHGRRRRGPAPLPAAAQRRLAQLRHQAGGQRPVRRDHRIPGQRPDPADQDGPGGQAGRGRPVAGPQSDRGDRPAAALHARRVADLAAAAPRHLLHRRPGPVDLRPEVRQSRA